MKDKPVAVGILKVDIYECNGRYPLDNGQPYTKEDIDSMFDIKYKKGTKFYGYKEGYRYVWFLKNGDGGWTDWEDVGVKNSIISNLDIKKKI